MKSCTINMGHTLQGADIGARGLNGLKEEVLTREIGGELVNILKAEGITTYISKVDSAKTLNESLNEQVKQCNDYDADMNVCIHTNAEVPSANGIEIYTYKATAHVEAVRILEELKKLGFAIRKSYPVDGIKSQSLALVDKTKAKTLYLELGFITNSYDASLIQKYGPRDIAKAIAKGLLGRDLKEENKYDESIPEGVLKVPGGYIEEAADGRLIIHKDRANYIAIGQGFIDLYWDDGKGNKGKKRLSE